MVKNTFEQIDADIDLYADNLPLNCFFDWIFAIKPCIKPFVLNGATFDEKTSFYEKDGKKCLAFRSTHNEEIQLISAKQISEKTYEVTLEDVIYNAEYNDRLNYAIDRNKDGSIDEYCMMLKHFAHLGAVVLQDEELMNYTSLNDDGHTQADFDNFEDMKLTTLTHEQNVGKPIARFTVV